MRFLLILRRSSVCFVFEAILFTPKTMHIHRGPDTMLGFVEYQPKTLTVLDLL